MFDLNKKEKPFTSFSGFGGGGLGLAGGAISAKTYVDDVFSTFLYDGNSSAQSINNGINLAGEGGLIWIKKRDTSGSHSLADTVTGINKNLISNSTNTQATDADRITAVSANGFTLYGNGTNVNTSGDDFVSWTFRKAPGFFDVVTYTGNGTAGRTISHSLGSVPGMIIVKCTDVGEPWAVYHRSLGNTKYLSLSETSTEQSSVLRWNNTTPTSSVFTVGSDPNVNQNTKNYVAYIFAHDEPVFGTDEDESIIKCGTVVTNGSPQEINLGFEPQFLILKKSSTSSSWYMIDTMRGFTASENPVTLKPNSTDAEGGLGNWRITNTGIKFDDTDNGTTWIYMAIRRPNKPPAAAINVFSVNTTTNDNNFNTTGFPVDFAIAVNTNHTYGNSIGSRLQGQKPMFTNTNASQAGWLTANTWTSNTSFRFAYAGNGYNYVNYAFKRAPGFMDVVAYSGTGSATGINHNLGVVPELMLVKCRSHGESWMVYANGVGPTETLILNNEQAASNFSNRWNGAPTSSVINVSTDTSVNYSGRTYVAYLFATLAGISKVGSYSGTGSANNIDCGFAASARFVLIKRTNADADWFVFDTARGMVSGNDFFSKLNENTSQTGGDDYIDPYATGFTINGTYSGLNASGGTYLFLAIA